MTTQSKIRLVPNVELPLGEIVDLCTNGQAIGVFKDGQYIDTVYHERMHEVFARRMTF